MELPLQMQCEQCDTANDEGHRFCDSCGTPLKRLCSECGCINRAGAKFCAECGAAVALSPLPAGRQSLVEAKGEACTIEIPQGERRQVTILFADVSNSTGLIQGLDPEQAAEELDPLLNIIIASIRQFGGTVHRVQGDGVMAIFGAPVAQEDHAARACFAAWGMLTDLCRQGDAPIRIGVNSGEVIIRAIATGSYTEFDIVGLSAHLAHRVEQICTPGHAYVTDVTRRSAEGYIKVKPLGEVRLRGFDMPTTVYELQGVISRRDRWDLRTEAQRLTQFTGRAAELSLLSSAWRRAQVGNGQLVTVTGEAGIGKSRLIYEFLRQQGGSIKRFFRVTAAFHDINTPYALASEMVRSWIGVREGDNKDVVSLRFSNVLNSEHATDPHIYLDFSALSWLLGLDSIDDNWSKLEPHQRRRRLIAATSAVVLRSAFLAPAVLVVEDVHWMDSESRTALEEVIEHLGAVNLLVIVSQRPDFQHNWTGLGFHTAIRLQPLDTDSSLELIDSLLGKERGPVGLASRIAERTGGVPLFLEEAAKSLIEAGVLSLTNSPAIDLVESIEIPETVQAALAERIDRLPPEQRHLLQRASVIGVSFSTALLCEIANLERSQLRRQLSGLQKQEFIFEVDPPFGSEYRFKHSLTQSVAYQGLLHKHQKKLHAEVLNAMERLNADRLDDVAERLAFHALRGEEWVRAVDYFCVAGTRAIEHSAHHQAINLFEHAFDALAKLPQTVENADRAIKAQLGLRVALGSTAELVRIRRGLEKAEILARATDRREALAIVKTGQANVLGLMGLLDEAESAALCGLELAESAGNELFCLNAKFALGMTYSFEGRFNDTLARIAPEYDKLVGSCRHQKLGTTGSISVLCLVLLSTAHAFLGNTSEAWSCARQSLGIARETGRPYDLSYSELACGIAALTQENNDLALLHLTAAYEHCSSAQIEILSMSVARFLGHSLALAGQLERARDLVERICKQCQAKSVVVFEAWCLCTLGSIYDLLGQQEAKSTIESALILAERHRLRPVQIRALRLKARNEVRQFGASKPAEFFWQHALELAEKHKMLPELAHACEELAHNTGMEARSTILLKKAYEIYRGIGSSVGCLRVENGLRSLYRSGTPVQNDISLP